MPRASSFFLPAFPAVRTSPGKITNCQFIDGALHGADSGPTCFGKKQGAANIGRALPLSAGLMLLFEESYTQLWRVCLDDHHLSRTHLVNHRFDSRCAIHGKWDCKPSGIRRVCG